MKFESVDIESSNAYRDALADLLVINKNFIAPPVCLFTGEEPLIEGGKKKLTVVYIPRALRIGFVVAVVVLPRVTEFFEESVKLTSLEILMPALFVSQLFLRKKLIFNIQYGESVRHLKSKRRKIGFALLLFVPLSVYGVYQSDFESLSIFLPLLILIPCLVIGLGLILGFPKALKVKKYKNGHFYLKGVHSSVLNQYPLVPDKLPPT